MPKTFLTLILVISLFFNAFQYFSNEDKEASQTITDNQFPYLANRIFVEHPNEILINFTDLRTEISSYAQKQSNEIGIYFNYLPTGIVASYQADKPFVSASLLKVPTVMKVYKMIEEEKVKKSDVLTIDEATIDYGYGKLWEKGIGAKITVEEALKESLKNSDNTAHKLLFNLSGGRPNDVYTYFDISINSVDGEAAITPRNYSSILRSLYFSAYLSQDNSNEILSNLLESEGIEELRSTVPEEIPIAMKYGIRERLDDSNEVVYSRCGIFYVPGKPYVLCIMAIGEEELVDEQMRDISNLVYKYIDRH